MTQITSALIDFTHIDPVCNKYPGNPYLIKNGFAAFVYPRGTGQIQPLWWAHCLIVPEFNDATGVKLFVPPTSAYKVTFNAIPDVNNPIGTGAGPFDPTKNNVVGNVLGAVTAALAHNDTPGHTAQMPYVDGAKTMQLVGTPTQVDRVDDTQHSSATQPLLMALSLASEIAQWTVMKNAEYEIIDWPSLTGTGVLGSSAGTITKAWFDTVGTIPVKYFWQPYGMRRMGCVSWEYNTYMTPPVWLNDATGVFTPPIAGPTGFAYHLERGVEINVQTSEAQYAASAMYTSLGEISWLASHFAGLPFPPFPE